ncbi:MAG: putative transport system ATP-binding protein [Solirubrobacteraceae bacterium]|nr:putative transport system ATP-binding protein [Solirubrobacteraceae bacterium]
MTGGAVLRAALRGQAGPLARASALLAGHQACEALVPVVVGATLDAAVATGDGGALVRWLVVLAVLFAALACAYRFGARALVLAEEASAHELRMRLAGRVLDARGGADAGRSPGELLSLATADADVAARVHQVVAVGAGVATALLVGAVVLVAISPLLGLVVLVGLPAVLGLAGHLSRPLTRRAGSEQARAAEAAGVATDLVGGLRVLQGIGGVSAGVERYRRASRRSLRATLAAARAEAAYTAAAFLVAGCFLAVVAAAGGRLAAAGDISVGQFIAAAGITQFLVGPLGRLSFVGAGLARARASAGRLAEVLSAPAAVGGAARPPAAPACGLRVAGLVHGPLRGVDVEVGAGELHGLAVTDPGDAAALLACLGREVDPVAGTVELGGYELTALEPGAARAVLHVAPHDGALFAETVAVNVAVIARDPVAVERAIAAAQVEEVASALPDGMATRLADGGRSLSGGQRQRIALARSLAADPPVLVLHDPTTALDAATEARVAEGLREVRAERTTVLVTTSPVLLAACDAVTLVQDGRVRARGRHAELLDGDAAYREAVLA